MIKSTLGLTVDQLLGGSIDRFHGSRVKEITDKLANPANFPIQTDTRLGDMALNLNATVVLDADGEIDGYMVTWSDVTHQRALEAGDMAISKAMAVNSFQLDGTIVEANENFCSTLGYAETEIVGQHHRIFSVSSSPETRGQRRSWKRVIGFEPTTFTLAT